LLSALFFVGHNAHALAPHYERSFTRQLEFITGKNPKYVWGGAAGIDSGLDCSGYLFLAAKWAGIPGITRTTAEKMSCGFGGWTGKDVQAEAAGTCDLIFWAFKKHRISHTGAIINKPGKIHVTHASPAGGVVLVPLMGKLETDLKKIRRLTIGDRNGK
jgi:cell wall-associated NlpC family hydrolase